MMPAFLQHDDDDACPASQPAGQDLLALEGVLRHWVRGRARPEVVLIDPDGGGSVSLDEVLVQLCASSAPLGVDCARRLGLSADATIAEAAENLLYARHDRDGPLCRSFRSASYYLYGLARIATAADAEVSVPSPTDRDTVRAGAGR